MSEPSFSIDDALRTAQAHHRDGNLELAEKIFQDILRIEPENPDALHLLGLLAQQRGQTGMAIDLIRKAIHSASGHDVLFVSLGDALKAEGHFDDALEAYDSALELNPGCADAHLGQGGIFRKQGRLDDAVSAYRQAIAASPTDAVAHCNLGFALQKQGRLGDAIDSYRRAITFRPSLADAHNNLGMALQAQGELGDALACYQTALDIRPDYLNAAYNLHSVLYRDSDPSAAAAALEQALGINPGHQDANFFLGVIREQLGDTAAAARHFARLKVDPDGSHPSLESWQYAKSKAGPETRFFTTTAETLRFGLNMASVEGLILEFGVSFGTSIRIIAGECDGPVYGFDSFQGLPAAWHHEDAGTYTTAGHMPEVPENVHLRPGLFEDTLPEFLSRHAGPVRFMNVDCDLYASTKTVFGHLGDRIVAGTIILFDEYFMYPGWQEDEFRCFQEEVRAHGWSYDYIAFNLVTKQAAVRIG